MNTILLALLLFQNPQLTNGTQEIIITVQDPIPTSGNEAGFASGVDSVLWGFAPDTYGPAIPVTTPCTQSSCNISVNWDTTKHPNGVITVYAKAFDKRGTPSLVASKTFNVQNDKTAPVITITAPQQGASVSGQVNITAWASDDYKVESMEVWVNGRHRLTVNGGSIAHRWNSTPDRRSYPISTIEVRARDSSGKESKKAIQVALR